MSTLLLALLGFIGASLLILSYRAISLQFRLGCIAVLGISIVCAGLKDFPDLTGAITSGLIDRIFGMVM